MEKFVWLTLVESRLQHDLEWVVIEASRWLMSFLLNYSMVSSDGYEFLQFLIKIVNKI